MADQETPGATAPDEGQRAPGGARPRAHHVAAAEAKPPVEVAPVSPPEPSASPSDPRKSFEDWAHDRFGVAFDPRGRASGMQKGKPVTKGGKAVKGATRSAALVNGARAKHRIPIGRAMTKAEFNKLLDAVSSIEMR